jgi:hypothetical protein
LFQVAYPQKVFFGAQAIFIRGPPFRPSAFLPELIGELGILFVFQGRARADGVSFAVPELDFLRAF